MPEFPVLCYIVASFKFLNPSGGIDDTLLTGEVRVTFTAKLDF